MNQFMRELDFEEHAVKDVFKFDRNASEIRIRKKEKWHDSKKYEDMDRKFCALSARIKSRSTLVKSSRASRKNL